MENQELLKKFIKALPTESEYTKQLFIIGFIGLNGVGKSFVAEKLSDKLGLYIASNDRIRRFLNDNGFKGASPAQLLVQEIAESSTKYLLENRINHIVDADLIQFHDIAQKNAKKYGAKLILIHLVCPEEIILQRLENRQKEIENSLSANLSRVGKERYFERKVMHESLMMPEIFFTMDTSKNVDDQIEQFTSKLISEEIL